MDKYKADLMQSQLANTGVGGWEIIEFIDHGKSAAVFKARRDEEIAAIKIFDGELISKYGDQALLQRLEREKWLVGHDHPNIVKMLDSGVEPSTGNHYLVMGLLEGRNLSKVLDTLPVENIPMLVEQLASAAEYLEGRGWAHRDIKPANIIITENSTRLVLLDFGILRPVGETGLTDNGGTPLFVGTNQYASPEFAMRKEDDTSDGWRAVTFYQMGAVIHDMLMKKAIFHKHTGVPARLAHAVQNEVPDISAADAPPYLAALAQNCLVKSPKARLQMVSWDNFKQQPQRSDRALELQERIRQRAAAAQTRYSEITQYSTATGGIGAQILHSAIEILKDTLRGLGQVDPPLPRRIVYDYPNAQSCIRADFEPAAPLGLSEGLSVCISCEVLDEKSRMISVTAAASRRREPSEWKPDRAVILYKGKIDQKAVQDAISLFVLSSVDEAQQNSISVQGNIENGGGH